jgi:hypothetical protein
VRRPAGFVERDDLAPVRRVATVTRDLAGCSRQQDDSDAPHVGSVAGLTSWCTAQPGSGFPGTRSSDTAARALIGGIMPVRAGIDVSPRDLRRALDRGRGERRGSGRAIHRRDLVTTIESLLEKTGARTLAELRRRAIHEAVEEERSQKRKQRPILPLRVGLVWAWDRRRCAPWRFLRNWTGVGPMGM